MSKQRMINTKFWDDNYIIQLDSTEKLLFLYFLSNPLTNISGVYEIPLRRISFDTGLDKDMVEKILLRFERDNKIYYRSGWIGIKNFIKHQNARAPGVMIGVERELESAPNELKTLIESQTEGLNPPPTLVPSVLNLTKLNLTKPPLASPIHGNLSEITYQADEELLSSKALKRKQGIKARGYDPATTKIILKWAEEKGGTIFPNPVKQMTAISALLAAGRTIEQIQQSWEEMENDPYWTRGFDFTNVLNFMAKQKPEKRSKIGSAWED